MRLAIVCVSKLLSRGRNMQGAAATCCVMPSIQLTGWVISHTRHNAAYTLTELIPNFLVVGDPLAETQAEAEKGVDFAKKARVGLAVDMLRSNLQLIRTLRGLTNSFGSFNDNGFDEAEFERHLASNPALAS